MMGGWWILLMGTSLSAKKMTDDRHDRDEETALLGLVLLQSPVRRSVTTDDHLRRRAGAVAALPAVLPPGGIGDGCGLV
jgi:hypothetical protein